MMLYNPLICEDEYELRRVLSSLPACDPDGTTLKIMKADHSRMARIVIDFRQSDNTPTLSFVYNVEEFSLLEGAKSINRCRFLAALRVHKYDPVEDIRRRVGAIFTLVEDEEINAALQTKYERNHLARIEGIGEKIKKPKYQILFALRDEIAKEHPDRDEIRQLLTELIARSAEGVYFKMFGRVSKIEAAAQEVLQNVCIYVPEKKARVEKRN
jgi:hypothetical protein